VDSENSVSETETRQKENKDKLSTREAYYPIPFFKFLEPRHTPVSLCHGDSLRRYLGFKKKACIVNNTEHTIYIIAYPYRITEFSNCFIGARGSSVGLGTRGVSGYRKSGLIIPSYHHQNIHPPGFNFYLSIFVSLTKNNDDNEIDDINNSWKPYLLNYSCDSRHDFYVQENIISALKSPTIPGYPWRKIGSYVAAHEDQIPDNWMFQNKKEKKEKNYLGKTGDSGNDSDDSVIH